MLALDASSQELKFHSRLIVLSSALNADAAGEAILKRRLQIQVKLKKTLIILLS